MRKKLMFFLSLLFISMTVTWAGAQQATVQIVPASYTVPAVGLTFNVNITVENVENLYGYEFRMYYPNDVLNGTSVTQGPFLKAGGAQPWFYVANFTDNYNGTNGLVNVLCARLGDVSGVNGSGTLVTITFRSTTLSNGPRTLHLTNVSLSDPNPAVILFTATDGEVTVIPEFPSALIVPLLMISCVAALTLRKRRRN